MRTILSAGLVLAGWLLPVSAVAQEPTPPTEEPETAPADTAAVGCPLDERPEGTAIVTGVVRDRESGLDLPGARVTLSWEATGDVPAGRTSTTADRVGRYMVCTVPTGVPVYAEARFPSREGGTTFALQDETELLTLDFELIGVATIRELDIASEVIVRRVPGAGDQTVLIGTVRDDETGDPLPGAQVALTDLGIGGVTDEEGYFEVAGVPAGPHQLVVDYLGYIRADERIDFGQSERVTASVRLVPAMIAMEALQVRVPVAESPAERDRRRGHTAHVVEAEEIAGFPAMELPEILSWTVPGFDWSMNSTGLGCPLISLRTSGAGLSSSALGDRPLIVIDGLKFRDTCILDMISPDDIERVEVFSGPAGGAIYGMFGGDGVIVITTKRQAG